MLLKGWRRTDCKKKIPDGCHFSQMTFYISLVTKVIWFLNLLFQKPYGNLFISVTSFLFPYKRKQLGNFLSKVVPTHFLVLKLKFWCQSCTIIYDLYNFLVVSHITVSNVAYCASFLHVVLPWSFPFSLYLMPSLKSPCPLELYSNSPNCAIL